MARTNRSRFPSYPPDLDPRLQNYLESIRRAVEDVVVGDMAIETATFEGAIYVDTIAEYTAAAGVTIDSCLIKDGVVSNAGISQSSVTQHQAALSIACTQLTGNMPDARIVASNVTQHNAALDHGVLAGIGDDDHSIYALLAGRAGGQTLIGSTAASENLTLQSTSHATRGRILTNDSLDVEGHSAFGSNASVSTSAVVHIQDATCTDGSTARRALTPTLFSGYTTGGNAEQDGVLANVSFATNGASLTGALSGVHSYVAMTTLSSGTMSSVHGYLAEMVANGVAATNAYGFRAKWSGASTVVNAYGLYLDSVTHGTTLNYAIYTNAGLVRFGGAVTCASTLGCGALTATTGTFSGTLKRTFATNAASGITLESTDAGAPQSPRLFFYNTNYAGTGVAIQLSANNVLTFYTGATPDSSTGTSRMSMSAAALYPTSSGGLTLGSASRPWGAAYMGALTVTGVTVGANAVLGAQGAAVADATGAGDVVAQLNTLLARARAHGLIAT